MVTTATPDDRRQFASDNCAGIAPEAWAALERSNVGHVPAYGEDVWTARAADLVREIFECDCEVFFTFTGTAANSLALAAMCQSYHSIICYELAHIETDECGGPAFFSNGTKVLVVGGDDGKIDLDAVEHHVKRRSDIHYPKPRVLSITQATELGTVYRLDELAAIQRCCRRLGLQIHMDGARLPNAIAALACSPGEVTRGCGVDVLCLSGTKFGAPIGDAVVFFNLDLAREFAYRCKQAGQLASKMRFIAAPWVGLLEDGAWLRYARHANGCAASLARKLAAIAGVEILRPAVANSVFVELSASTHGYLQSRGWHYYSFIGGQGARFMCSWDTSETDIEALVRDVEDGSRAGDGAPEPT